MDVVNKMSVSKDQLTEKEKAEYISKEKAWNFAFALNRMAGLQPSEDFLEQVELEKQGKITTEEMLEYLNRKYKNAVGK